MNIELPVVDGLIYPSAPLDLGELDSVDVTAEEHDFLLSEWNEGSVGYKKGGGSEELTASRKGELAALLDSSHMDAVEKSAVEKSEGSKRALRARLAKKFKA